MINGPRVQNQKRLRILVAPLDWGLGHATRCIPVIYELLRQDVDVWLAGEGAQEMLLKEEFPGIPFLSLRGYRVRYGRNGVFRSLLRQLPRFSRTISREHRWLKHQIDEHGFDAVISDNRFGLYHPSVPCVFMTHQLQIKTPLGKWSEGIARIINYRFINRFHECWIPDDQHRLAGELSHPPTRPAIPIYYTGILSRLKKTELAIRPHHLLIMLSGPEPQRSLLEDKVVDELSHYPWTATVLRGLPGSATHIPGTNDLTFHNHLPADAVAIEMLQAEYIICRSGYSTVMDVISLGKKPIFIPTPGQTEQEYLAEHLSRQGIGCYIDQPGFNLSAALEKARQYSYREIQSRTAISLGGFIQSFLQRLRSDDRSKSE
jgi:hypothetical protein